MALYIPLKEAFTNPFPTNPLQGGRLSTAAVSIVKRRNLVLRRWPDVGTTERFHIDADERWTRSDSGSPPKWLRLSIGISE